MKYKEIDLQQNTTAWKIWRNQGIGSSDAPIIMGENKFKSLSKLLYEKKNNISSPKNNKMIKGSELEETARQNYFEKFGIQLIPLCIESAIYPWLRASLDGISEERNHLVEIKCGESAYKQAKKGRIPIYYYGQLQHQMMITGLEVMYYWCFWPNRPGIRILVQQDNPYIDKLFIEEEKFFSLLSSY